MESWEYQEPLSVQWVTSGEQTSRKTDTPDNIQKTDEPILTQLFSIAKERTVFSWVEKYCEVLEADGQHHSCSFAGISLVSKICFLPPSKPLCRWPNTKLQERFQHGKAAGLLQAGHTCWTNASTISCNLVMSSDCNHLCQENGCFLNRDFYHRRLFPCTFDPRKFSQPAKLIFKENKYSVQVLLFILLHRGKMGESFGLVKY